MSFRVIKVVKNILYNRPKENTNMMLGRWNLKNNQDIAGVLANMDSCGDKLCGDMGKIRQAIQSYVVKRDSK